MATILYKDGIAHRISPYRVQQHLAAGYSTNPEGITEDSEGELSGEEVEGDETEIDSSAEPSKPAFPTDDKVALEAWAKENLGIDLDKRKGLKKLIAEVDAAMAPKNTGIE